MRLRWTRCRVPPHCAQVTVLLTYDGIGAVYIQSFLYPQNDPKVLSHLGRTQPGFKECRHQTVAEGGASEFAAVAGSIVSTTAFDERLN